MDEENKISLKDIPSYHWPTKEEGKEQYAKFSKDFLGTLKNLRFLLEPGGIERFLGREPGRRPAAAGPDRQEWLTRSMAYETKRDKLEMHAATALGALERSFPYGTTPRNIIDKAAQAPEDVPPAEWTYQRRFLACWEALRIEYQPSTSVDLKQLRDQIYKLTDEGPGGFENFRSEFHRLHTEITATGVVEAITNRELNEIVRDGIKNQFVWVNICYDIYKDNPNSPWQATLEAVSTALTSYRQKGFDPYAEAKSESVSSTPSRSWRTQFLCHLTEINKEPIRRISNLLATSLEDSRRAPGLRAPFLLQLQTLTPTISNQFRCWQAETHSYRFCTELKCSCGSSRAPGKVICFNYENEEINFFRSFPLPLDLPLDGGWRGMQNTVEFAVGREVTRANQEKTRRHRMKSSKLELCAEEAQNFSRRQLTRSSRQAAVEEVQIQQQPDI